MATPAAIVPGAQRVSIASAWLDAVGEASAARVSRRPHAGSASVAWAAPHAGASPVALAAPHAGASPVALAAPHAGAYPVARTSPVVRSRGRRRPRASSARELSNGGDRR